MNTQIRSKYNLFVASLFAILIGVLLIGVGWYFFGIFIEDVLYYSLLLVGGGIAIGLSPTFINEWRTLLSFRINYTFDSMEILDEGVEVKHRFTFPLSFLGNEHVDPDDEIIKSFLKYARDEAFEREGYVIINRIPTRNKGNLDGGFGHLPDKQGLHLLVTEIMIPTEKLRYDDAITYQVTQTFSKAKKGEGYVEYYVLKTDITVHYKKKLKKKTEPQGQQSSPVTTKPAHA